MSTLTKTNIAEATELPHEVVPVEKIPQWLNQTRLSQDPFTDFITTTNDEKEAFFQAEMKKRHDSIMTYQQRLKKEVQEATTEAKWRRMVNHLLRSLRSTMAEWQLWHQLWLTAKNGWLGGPLWHLRTARQGDTLASMMMKGLGRLQPRSFDGPGQPNKSDFKTMGVKSERDWQALAKQLDDSFTIDDVQVDVGRVPLPHNESTHSDSSVVAKYLYRTGRLDENGPTDAADEKALFTNGTDNDPEPAESQEPQPEADPQPEEPKGPGPDPEPEREPESEAPAELPEEEDDQEEPEEKTLAGLEAEADGEPPEVQISKEDAKSYHETAKTRVYSNFSDVKAVKMRHIKEKAWMRGYPNPWDMFGTLIDSHRGIQRYEYNRGEKHDNRKENYILDLHTGYIWLVPGIEGPGVYKALTKMYDKDDPIASALSWMELTKNVALEAQSRHNRLEVLLRRAANAGMHNVHELYENEQAGVGPPPSSRRLDNLEKRVNDFLDAEEKIQSTHNTLSNEVMSQ